MKRYMMCILSFMMFFSFVDLSCISILKNYFNNDTSISISDVVSVQYEVFEKTKQAFSGICDDIVKEVYLIISGADSQNTYIDFDGLYFVNNRNSFVIFSFLNIADRQSKILQCLSDAKIPLFIFGFIFMFMLRYLGLLFTFGRKEYYFNIQSI